MSDFLPILILLVVIGVILVRIPKIDLGHSALFKRRRLMNWLPLGLTYAFLYMGRYNLTVAKNSFGELMPKSEFGLIFAVGAFAYGLSFIINGPLTDKFGGRRAILIAASGSALMNLLMGLYTLSGLLYG
jgi:MFS transporter, OPA family, glycerol-3-phosphate transporter